MSHAASWMSFKDIVSVAAQRCQERAMQEIHSSVLGHYANEASIEFARRSEVVFNSTQLPLIADQRLYRLPFDCIRPSGIYIKYPGETQSYRIAPELEKDLADSRSRERTGKPTHWYYSKDRTQIGLYPVPSNGGFDGLSTAGTTTTLTLETGASTTDDYYNGMSVLILSGSAQGQTTTVSDYVGSTMVVTLTDTLTASAGACRVQIGNDQLTIEYNVNGNTYAIKNLSTLVSTAVGTPRYSVVPTTSGSYGPDYFFGCEVRFSDTTTTTLLQGTRTRVVSSYGSLLNVFPHLLTAPVNADVVEINSVPNLPNEYHHFLADYVCFKALERIDRQFASSSLLSFERGIEEAKRLLQPIQGDEYETIRGGYWDQY